jgi:glycosyltransferase 2 family protein
MLAVNSTLPQPSREAEESFIEPHPATSTTNAEKMTEKRRGLPGFRLFAVYFILAVLLYLALRNVPLIEIWEAVRQLKLTQIGMLLLLNALVIAAMTARWWVIIRAENATIPFLTLVRYRLAVFGFSYFTPGPQVGGEPLQVIYLQRYHGISFARATSAVIMDKLLEFLANFILIAAGVTAAVRVGLISRSGVQASVSLIPMVVVLLWPIIHLVLLYRGRYPISGLLRALSSLTGDRDWMRLIIVAERMAASFTRRKLGWLLVALSFSVIAWTGMAVEYFLMASFLNADLSLEQTLAALTAALVAFLMPLPGGLGALEASQVYAFQAMGYSPAIAIGISLMMRGRDIMNGVIGLLLAGKGTRKQMIRSNLSQSL